VSFLGVALLGSSLALVAEDSATPPPLLDKPLPTSGTDSSTPPRPSTSTLPGHCPGRRAYSWESATGNFHDRGHRLGRSALEKRRRLRTRRGGGGTQADSPTRCHRLRLHGHRRRGRPAPPRAKSTLPGPRPASGLRLLGLRGRPASLGPRALGSAAARRRCLGRAPLGTPRARLRVHSGRLA
jgi:hypothetical protein